MVFEPDNVCFRSVIEETRRGTHDSLPVFDSVLDHLHNEQDFAKLNMLDWTEPRFINPCYLFDMHKKLKKVKFNLKSCNTDNKTFS